MTGAALGSIGAGEIALSSPEPDGAKAEAEAYFERALAIARAQHAKSCALQRAWRDHGKRDEARDLLAPCTAGSPKASTRST
jgi:hypothetical protein